MGMQPSDSLKTAKQALKGEQLNLDVLQCPTCRCQLEGVYNSLGSVYLYSSGAEGPFDGGFGVAVRMRSALGMATGLGHLCPHQPLPGGTCAARFRVSACACAGLVPGNELGEWGGVCRGRGRVPVPSTHTYGLLCFSTSLHSPGFCR